VGLTKRKRHPCRDQKGAVPANFRRDITPASFACGRPKTNAARSKLTCRAITSFPELRGEERQWWRSQPNQSGIFAVPASCW
jgi:hypothetical protein